MISVFLQGGLGNQLFQIAAAYSLAVDNNSQFCLCDDFYHLPLQGNNYSNYKDNIYSKIQILKEKPDFSYVYDEKSFNFSKIDYRDEDMFIRGYFQSEKYFKHNEMKVRELFFFPEESVNNIKNKYEDILSGDNNIFLHVRRGDYINLSQHPVCEMSYYKEAISNFDSNSNFLIFSDDIDWCKRFFKRKNHIVIESNNDYEDLYLMSQCQGGIMANSSFSWWGAWLIDNQNKKIIAPKKWFGSDLNHDISDLIPESWIKI